MTSGTIVPPTLTDNCWATASLTLTYSMTGATTGSGTGSVAGLTFNAGITSVTYTVKDPDGNTASCSFTVTIIPFNPPVFTAGCPADVTVDAEAGQCDAAVTLPVPLVTDPCTIGYTVTNTGNVNGRYPVGTTTVTWTITPTVGAPTTCTQTITVNDLLPALTCPGKITTQTDTGKSYASNVSVPHPTYGDNCPNLTLTWVMFGATTDTSTNGPGTVSFVPSPNTFNLGVTTITYTLTDSNNHVATCSFEILVVGIPVINCPATYTSTTDPGVCKASINPGVPTLALNSPLPDSWTWTMTGATSGSGGNSGATPSPVVPNPFGFNTGVTTITWTACNISGCSSCEQAVVVTDDEPPTFTMPGTVTECVEKIQTATYNDPTMDITPARPDYYIFVGGSPGDTRLDISGLTDNCCGTASLTINWRIDFSGGGSISGTGQLSKYGSDITFPGDSTLPYDTDLVHTITYWVVDCHGNTSPTQTQNIVIKPRPDVKKVP